MSSPSPKQLWELALKERWDKCVIAGPPAWLVEENRKKDEDVHTAAQRVREELGLVR